MRTVPATLLRPPRSLAGLCSPAVPASTIATHASYRQRSFTDAAVCTQGDLAAALAALGLGDQARFFKAASLSEARQLARSVARELDAPDHGQLPYAFAAFALAIKHDQPGLEDIARRNLRSARRFAGLGDPEPQVATGARADQRGRS